MARCGRWPRNANGILYKEDHTGNADAGGQRADAELLCEFHDALRQRIFSNERWDDRERLPRQYDDTNLDRVSQGGPGAGPTVVDENAIVCDRR